IQDMVADAPKFYEVAKQIVEITEGAVFVAHNVRFDYSFVKQEFSRLGFAYTRKQLCTVRLSRKTFPELTSYGLSNLARHFNIPNDARHRAMGDAMATTKLFNIILEHERSETEIWDMVNLGIKESLLPSTIDLEKIHALPEDCGVYYFHDEQGNVVYVGKSINLKKRVAEHFSKISRKGAKMQRFVRDISYERTGSELIALLLESYEIKRLQPAINRAQRNKHFPYTIHQWKDENGYIRFTYDKIKLSERKNLNIVGEYPTVSSVRGKLAALQEKFGLCSKLMGKEKGNGPCFAYHLKQCTGACIGIESPEAYNERVQEALPYLGISFDQDFLIIDNGRNPQEQSIVLIKNGQYQGFGYIEKDESFQSVEDLDAHIKSYPHNTENMRIILSHIHRKKSFKLVKL
ncbi:MAG: exonuclease domain-containing protein, partial [Bacteroidota bacterium]